MTDGREVREPLGQFLNLLLNQLADVKARSTSRLLDGDDLLDLIERESEALCLTHEGEQVQRLAAVHPRGKVKRGRLILRSGCVPLPPAGRSCRP